MPYRLLADAVVVLHLTFVLFVIAGGLFVLKWKRLTWVHLPAVIWGVSVEWLDVICPLTPLENWFRAASSENDYKGDFLQQYAISILYPDNLTRDTQIVLGALLLLINVFIYSYVLRENLTRGRIL